MPIRGLDGYLTERRQLVHELPLTALKDCRLGIDGSFYVESLLKSKGETYVSAVGGLPVSFSSALLDHLKILESSHIKPVFVFDGLQPGATAVFRREAMAQASSTKLDARSTAWEQYESDMSEEADSKFAESSTLTQKDVFRQVQRAYKHRNVEHVVAPYTAAAQLVYLANHEKSYVHAVSGPSELLVYDHIDKLILDINWAKQSFTFVNKRDLLADLGVSSDQFLDLALLAGCDYAPTFPPLQPASQQPQLQSNGNSNSSSSSSNNNNNNVNLRAAVSMLHQFRSGAAAIHSYLDATPALRSSDIVDQFAQSRALVKFPLVLAATQGRVLPLPLALSFASPTEVPQDLAVVFSHRLPDELLFQFWRGLFGSTVLDALTTGVWSDEVPLDGGESEDYKRFLRDTLSEHPQGPKAVALGLISSVLNPELWGKRQVNARYYFDLPPSEGTPSIPHNSQLTKGVIDRVNLWNVPLTMIQDELRRQHSNTLDLMLCLGATSNHKVAAATKTPRKPSAPLEKKDEITANVLWRFLEIRGFLNNEHSHTAYAKALYQALKASRINDKFQEPLFLALELIRSGVLHSGKYGGVIMSGGPDIGDESEQAKLLLILRTVSIVPVTFLSVPYDGPLSRELLVFNSFQKTLMRTLRALVESTTVHMLLRGDARRNREDWLDITMSLPFGFDTNTVMGIIVKIYCDIVHSQEQDENPPPHDQSIADAINILQDALGTCIRDVRAEVQRAFRFWDGVCLSVKVLKDEKAIAPELAAQFEEADAWLRSYRN